MKALLLLSVALIVGCASNGGSKVSDGRTSIKEVKENKFQIPEWYVSLPSEPDTIFASATEVSTDLQFSIDKALMSAKRDIAFKLQNDISQKHKEYSTESNYTKSDRLSKETERLMIANSKYVNLVGVQRVRTEIINENGRYRAFVLVRYSLDESNKIHANNVAKERRASAKKEMDKFDNELREGTSNTPANTNRKEVLQREDAMLGPMISDPVVRAQVLKAYDNPDAVIIKGTIR